MTRKKQSPVPATRLGRMLRLGKMVGGVAAGALGHGVSQLARGQVPAPAELLLNPGSADRVAKQLSEMRGAAMKLGQLLSMEAGELLPRELTEMLAGLRDSAHAMPFDQLNAVLERNWGCDWRRRFEFFEPEPFAAASIGQVHAAIGADGRRLAVKVQYPGVAASIDSDLRNVAALLGILRLLPPGFDIEPLLELARGQLHDEADYRLEALHLRLYRGQLGSDVTFRVPEVVDELSSAEILAMTHVEGDSIETLARAPAAERDFAASRIIELTLREFLDWGMVQSDPNFANFLYNAADRTIGLLDFGALRISAPERAESFIALIEAAREDDLQAIIDAAIGVGYLDREDAFNFRMAIADLVRTAAEPARHNGHYDFSRSQLAQRLGQKLFYLRNRDEFQRLPPADVLFLHRKLAGIYLLCARIHARVDVRACIDAVLLETRNIPAVRAAG